MGFRCVVSRSSYLVLSTHFFVNDGAKLTSNYTFALYKEQYGRNYEEGTKEHRLREAIFQTRLAEIRLHNAGAAPWKKGINHMTDYTEDELDMLLGHKPLPKRMHPALGQRTATHKIALGSSLLEGGGVGGNHDASCSNFQGSCLEAHESCCAGLVCGSEGTCETVKRVESFDWSPELSTAHEVLEQGRCGSCWAVAAAAAINLHAEKASGKRFNQVLSPENLLACTPNKFECGGRGGCKGATAELAFDWLAATGSNGGLGLLSEQGYDAKDDRCPVKMGSFLQKQNHMVTIKGWKKLPDNTADDMINALVTVGPLVASMAAKGIHGYDSGIIDNCDALILNHAVVMMGYGTDKTVNIPYWNVRNSWGKRWGENGFFRLQRFAPTEKEPCGWDLEPDKGVACKDKEGPEGKYPAKQWVCGACAILADTAYPIGITVPDVLLQTRSLTETQLSGSSGAEAETVSEAKEKERVSCKTQCQHFAMPELTKKYGREFSDDPTDCSLECDEVVF